MSGRARLTLCAFAATMLASGVLLPLVNPSSWIVQAAFLLGVQSGVGALTRRVPLARPLTVLAQAVTALLLLTVIFARGQAIVGILPDPDVVRHFGQLLRQGADDVGQYSIPAPATSSIRLMLIGGVLLIGLLVDTLAVTFRSAAPAGLPLLALYSVGAGIARSGSAWLWFVLAASGYLLLLLAEGRDRLSQWGRVFGGAPRAGNSQGFESGGSAPTAPVRTGRRIGAVALGFALVVPAALPALDAGLLGGTGPGTGPGGGGGTISAVNPLVSLQNSLTQSDDREVMRYRTNASDTGGLYLRIVSLDQFDGTAWKSSERRIEDVPAELPQPEGLSPQVGTTQIRTNISAAGWYAQNWLPLPYPATKVSIKGRWRFEPTGRTLVGDRGQTTRGVQYGVNSLVVQPTATQLATAPAPADRLLREYTKVPGSLPDVVKSTAEQVTAGAANDYERAVKMQDWFASEGGFTYDTQVQSGTGSAAIARFLKQKQGFCVHFAFTMAAMARTLKIPARVAVGFTPGTVQQDGSMSVGLRDAHAWPELYFQGVGWTRFEPTPTRGSVPSYTRTDTSPDSPATPAQPENTSSAAPVATPSSTTDCPPQMRKMGDCGGSSQLGGGAPTDRGTPLAPVIGAAVAVALLVLLILLPMLWRIRVRARRLGSGGRTPADGAHRTLSAWREIIDSAWDVGIVPDESRTPRSTADRIVRAGGLHGPAADAVHRAAGAVEQVLYAPQPGAAGGLTDDVHRIRAGLRAAVGRTARLRAVMAPRSAIRVTWELSGRRTAVAARLRQRLSGLDRWATALRRPSRQRG
ncbi:transglutaminase TgpA family protein [Streptomyces sp. NBC_00344]|uniref:transglutaminase TgpA family protein n=1 Tax=Streptomyces sp. NBC_00344 TaxID=2975720 RepID=UPI002E21FEBD